MQGSNLPQIKFSSLWNGCKPLLDIFPTFRLANADKYRVGRLYNCYVGKHFIGRVELVRIDTISYHKITEGMAFVDVGKPLPYLKNLLNKFYPKANWSVQKLYWLWFKHLDHEKTRDNLIHQRSGKLGIQADLFQTQTTRAHHNH